MAVQVPGSPPAEVTPIATSGSQAGGRLLTRALNRLEAQAMFVVGVISVLVVCLATIPTHLAQDGWLALVAGRVIAAHGVPQHDYLTVMAHGVRWIDQQWLSQLIMYELVHTVGLAGMTFVYVIVSTAAFAVALLAASSLGAQGRHMLFVLPAAGLFYLATAVSIRTQGFAYPLFVAVLWLLAAEFPRASAAAARGRAPTARGEPRRLLRRDRRVYLVFPLLIVWANVHGSATMGVGLASLYGLVTLVGGVRRDRLRGLRNRRGWAFLVLSPLTLFATPYGTAMGHYYAVTLMNPEFSKMVTEWRPITATPVLAVPLAALMLATAWVLVRGRRRTPAFDVVVLVVLAAGAVDAVRNVTWFGLAVMMLLPPAISRMCGDRPAPLRRARVNLVLAIVMIVAAAGATAAVLSRPTTWFTSTYPSATVTAVDRMLAADPQARIFADVHYADWLVWQQPDLAGRIAYDTSLELLTRRQLGAIALISGTPTRAGLQAMQPYAIWLLNPGNRRADRVLLRQPGVQIVVRNRRVIVATHRPSERPG
jgi:hypothetical protein